MRSALPFVFTVTILILLVSCKTDEVSTREIFEARIGEPAVDNASTASVRLSGGNFVPGDVLVRTRDVAKVEVTSDDAGKPALMLQLTESAGLRMESSADRYINRPLLFYANGELMSAPIARSKLGRSLLVAPTLRQLSSADLEQIAKQINRTNGAANGIFGGQFLDLRRSETRAAGTVRQTRLLAAPSALRTQRASNRDLQVIIGRVERPARGSSRIP